MFDLVAKLLSSIATFLFPIFASYKALQANDPAQLIPWLMYWVVFNCALLFESWTEWILVWIPFYPWIRLSILLYLVLPQTQGAKLAYIQYIHPFLHDHEAEIEAFIAKSHDRARAAGLQYYSQVVDAVREFLGMEPRQMPSVTPTAAPPTTAQSTGAYVQNLLSRFDLPSAAAAATSFLQQQQFTTTNPISPPHLQPQPSETPGQRLASLAAQRARFLAILQSLDREAQALNLDASSLPPRSESMDTQDLKKSKSESEFERVEREDVGVGGEVGRGNVSGSGGGGWMPWSWGGKGVAATQEMEEHREVDRGSATGVDARDDSSSAQYRQGRWQGQS